MAKEARFKKRKEVNPVETKMTVAETGTIHGFKGTTYEEAGLSADDADGAFLADRVWFVFR